MNEDLFFSGGQNGNFSAEHIKTESGNGAYLFKPSQLEGLPPRPAIVENFLYEDTVTFLFGHAGVYKSWLALYECVCLCLGKDLFGQKVNGNQCVLYVSLEMSLADIGERLRLLECGMKLTDEEIQTLDNYFLIIASEYLDDGMSISDKDNNAFKLLEEICSYKGINIIYIDSFQDLLGGADETNGVTCRECMKDMQQFAKDNRVCLRLIHHATKPGKDKAGNSTSTYAGGHAIRDLADGIRIVVNSGKNEITYSNDTLTYPGTKKRYEKITTTFNLKINSDDFSFSFSQIDEMQTASNLEAMKNIRQAVSDDPGITLRNLKRNHKGKEDLIQSMIKNGELRTKEEKKKGQTSVLVYLAEEKDSSDDL